MASSSKSKDRRAVVEQVRRDQQKAERRRTLAVIAACAAVALVIIGLGAYPLVKDKLTQDELGGKDLTAIGASSADGGCRDVRTVSATGSGEHKTEGEEISYPDAPPAFGPHFDATAPLQRKFYTEGERPEVGNLVHNLEHGYTIMWYDETVADDDTQLAQVKAIANKFAGDTDATDKLIAAPWTEEDGEAFPNGAHVALTHWSMGGTNGNDAGQLGIWQYCEAPSGEAVSSYVEDYPYTDSPEPNAP